MSLYERPFAERLRAEAERIPLPPRERWTPRERSGLRLLPALATLVVLALVVLVVGPVAEQWSASDNGVAPASSEQSAAGAAPSSCAPARDRTTPAACLLSGKLVEIVGHDGGLMASTPLVRVKLDDANLSAHFGNPTLFEADAHTQIEPSSATIAATGVKPGAQVLIAFDERGPKTSSGAYLLTRFIVVLEGRLPNCLRHIDAARFDRGATDSNSGATPEEAFRKAYPAIVEFSTESFATNIPKAPVWIVAGSETFIASILPDGTWYVSPAKFVQCGDPKDFQTQLRPNAPTSPPAPTFPMNAPGVAPDPITPEHVAAGMLAGAVIFAQADPSCALETDGKTYRCTLRNAPVPETSSLLDSKQLLVIAGRVAGGCVGLGRDGMTWNCFLGQDAVDQRIIDKGLLGQPAPVPARG
jgi:hypothetical protein